MRSHEVPWGGSWIPTPVKRLMETRLPSHGRPQAKSDGSHEAPCGISWGIMTPCFYGQVTITVRGGGYCEGNRRAGLDIEALPEYWYDTRYK